MSIQDLIFQDITGCEDDERYFITREFLVFGNRGSVDVAMFNLVRKGVLERLAWGLFRLSSKFLERELPELTDEEVAEAKANAFRRFTAQALHEEGSAEEPSIPVTGHTTKFRRLLGDRAHFRNVELKGFAKRKIDLSISKHGAELFKIWKDGKKNFELYNPSLPDMSDEINLHRVLAGILPNWLKKHLNLRLPVAVCTS